MTYKNETTTMRRVVDVVLVSLVLLGAGLSACGRSKGEERTTTPTSTTISAKAASARFPTDQIVWQAETAGGLVSQVAWAAQRPSLTIYGDGRVFLSRPGLDPRYDQPIELMTGTVPRRDLAIFVARAEASGLFDDVDLGHPDVTDMATTTVTLHGSRPAVHLRAYALGGRFDADLSEARAERREALRQLLSAAEDLVAKPTSWTPPRIRVLVLPDRATFEPKPDTDPDVAPARWPGPAPATFTRPAPAASRDTTVTGCGEVTGDEAGRLFDAAQRNPLPTWKVGTGLRTIVVVALLPGETACGPA